MTLGREGLQKVLRCRSLLGLPLVYKSLFLILALVSCSGNVVGVVSGPEAFTVSHPTSSSLTLSWKIPLQAIPISFSLSYSINKLSGTPPTMTTDSLSIPIGDADLITTDNENFSYVLGDLTAYTEYSFNLSSVYGNAISDVVSASGTTSEAKAGPVRNLTSNSTKSSHVSISWSQPVEPRGLILHYSYTVTDIEHSKVVARGNVSETFVKDLMIRGDPHTVSVRAVNSAGEGEDITIIVSSTENSDDKGSNNLSTGLLLGIAIPLIIIIMVTALVLIACYGRLGDASRRCISRQTEGASTGYNLLLRSDTQQSLTIPPHHPQLPQTIAHTVSDKGAEADVERLKEELGNRRMIIPKRYLELSSVIGQGESGIVYRGYINYESNRELVAIKTCKALSRTSDMERLMKEVSAMFSFKHPNVMSLIGVCYDEGVPLVIMPFMMNGTVLDYVRRNREALHCTSPSEVESARKVCLDMCLQISKGMAYLTNQKFVHRDLAARNCMIDENGVVKVADFGLTEDIYCTSYLHCQISGGRTEERLPIRWMAPESIENNIFNEKTDVWSYGVTCWEIFTCGGVPYAGINVLTLTRELCSGHRLERPCNHACSDEIWDVMQSCWAGHPLQRPKFVSLTKMVSQLLEKDSNYLKICHSNFS